MKMEKNVNFKHGLWAVKDKGGSIRETIKRICIKCDGYAHDIHHIDGNNKNNKLNNLQPLCRKCHMEKDGRYFNFINYARIN